MTKEELAEKLNGRQEGYEIADHEMGAIKASGLVVLFGASDDLLELRGVVYDEVGAYQGRRIILFAYRGTLEVIDADCVGDLEEARQQVAAEDSRDRGNVVQATWAPKEVAATWLITTKLPHASFDILCKERLYCRGIVLSINDLR